jgi:pimeloyl-ACP methyl ester carboxylesterase
VSRSSRADAMPIVLLHGWPSSAIEYTGIIAHLTEPPSADVPAFHVIVPSLPGFGFSGPTTTRGWSSLRMASAVAELLRRLGFRRYLVHGGDLGFHVASDLAVVDAQRVAGIHLNLGGVRLAGEHANEVPQNTRQSTAIERYHDYIRDKSGYALLQATRPQTISYALSDSPIGQLAWIAEKFDDWTDPVHPVCTDTILDTAAIYWFTRTAGSSARSYQESYGGRGGIRPYVDVATSVSVFPFDIVPPIQAWAEEHYRIVDWAEMPAGGHFPGLERPDLMVEALQRFALAIS